VDGGATLAQLAAQVGEVGIAGDEAEGFGAIVEEGFERVQRERDVRGVLARGVLVLQAGREGLSHQRLLPAVGKRRVVAVAAAQHDAAELRHDAQRELEDLGSGVVAIDEDGDAGFGGCAGAGGHGAPWFGRSYGLRPPAGGAGMASSSTWGANGNQAAY